MSVHKREAGIYGPMSFPGVGISGTKSLLGVGVSRMVGGYSGGGDSSPPMGPSTLLPGTGTGTWDTVEKRAVHILLA